MAELFGPIYARLAPGVESYSVLLGGQDARADTAVAGIAASRSFAEAEVSTFAWRRTHDTAEWLALLQTHSDHQTLAGSSARAAAGGDRRSGRVRRRVF